VTYRPDVQLSKASSVQTTRTFSPDLPLCREASNCSSLHPSGRFSSTSGRLSVFDKLQDFFPKHSYVKITATIRATWIPIHKASIAFKIQTSGRQSAWFGRASIRYEKCVHQIWKMRASDQPLGRPSPWSERAKP
jgi:hypothetical protein